MDEEQFKMEQSKIVEQSPLLEAFLDPEGSSGSDLWAKMVDKQFQIVLDKIRQQDEGIDKYGSTAVAMMANHTHILNETFPSKVRGHVARLIFCLGYELPTAQAVGMLTPAIYDRLAETGVLNQAKLSTDEEQDNLYEAVQTMVSLGSIFHRMKENDRLKPFEDFLETLQ